MDRLLFQRRRKQDPDVYTSVAPELCNTFHRDGHCKPPLRGGERQRWTVEAWVEALHFTRPLEPPCASFDTGSAYLRASREKLQRISPTFG